MPSKITSIDIAVRYAVSAYNTNTVRGQRVSCTHSADEAARRLGDKLLGTGFKHAERLHLVDGEGHLVARFRRHGIEEISLVL